MTHAVPGITLTALGKEIEIRLSIQPLDAYIPCCTQHRESQLVIVLCQIRARGGGGCSPDNSAFQDNFFRQDSK